MPSMSLEKVTAASFVGCAEERDQARQMCIRGGKGDGEQARPGPAIDEA